MTDIKITGYAVENILSGQSIEFDPANGQVKLSSSQSKQPPSADWVMVPREITPEWLATYMALMRLTNKANARKHIRTVLAAAPQNNPAREDFKIGHDPSNSPAHHAVLSSQDGPADAPDRGPKFKRGDLVKKKGDKGQWHGVVCGFYSTSITPYGYAVESTLEKGSVQIYPETALEPWDGETK